MIHVLTRDTARAEDLGAYLAHDWRGAERLRAAWSVAFGPVTEVLFLQEASGGVPPVIPLVPEQFVLERRERQWLRAESPHRAATDGIALFELRRYDVRVGQGVEFLDLMLGALPIRQRYSSNFGIWSSLSGRHEQVLHLWGYRNLAERDIVRAQLKRDAEWGVYTARILPMLEKLTSTILTPLPLC